jgi:AraC-like DNA-binding protein
MESDEKISVVLVFPLVQAVLQKGVSPSSLLEASRVDTEILDCIDNRLTVAQYDALIGQAAVLTSDGDFGLHQGELSTPGNLSLLGYILMNSPTLQAVLNKYLVYEKILCDFVQCESCTSGDTVKFVYTIEDSSFKNQRHLIDSIMSTMVTSIRQLTGMNMQFKEVRFRYKAPDSLGEYRRIFNCPLSFQENENAVLFEKKLLNLPILFPDPKLLQYFEQQAQEVLRKLDSGKPYTGKANRIMMKLLKKQTLNVENLAKNMAMSVRSLQLKLKEEGTTFSMLQDNIFKNIATNYLKNRDISIEEIAFLLGFSEPSSFYRTFKRWTGTTPARYRESTVN